MRTLTSGIRWLLVAGLLLLAVAAVTLTYQYRVVSGEIERVLTAQLRVECELLGLIIEGGGRLPETKLSGDRRLTMIASDGQVLYDSSAEQRTMVNHNDRPEVTLARRDGFAISRRLSDTTHQDYLYAGKLLHNGVILRLAAPLTVEDSLVKRLSLPVILSTAVVVLGGGLALLVYTWRSRERVADLVEVSRAFGAGDFARRAQLVGSDAFARLGHELNNLGSRLRESQERVVAQRQLLDGALGSLSEGVACIDQLDRVVYANASYRQFAAGGADVLGQPYYRYLSADVIGLAITALNENHDLEIGSLRFEHRRRHLQAVVAQGGEGISVLVLHDRTELMRAEAARRDFLSAVSHELKTPLTAIIGYGDTLLDGALEQPEVAQQMVSGIVRHGTRLLELVRDVLTLSRLEHGAWLVRSEPIDWAHLARTVLDDHRAAATAKPVTMHYDGPDSLPGRCDPELVRQLIGNLVSNAVRYNRPEGHVHVRLAATEGRLQLIVEDTGIGIPVEHQSRIFERFYRVDAHRNRAIGGTGLGLAIVKHLCEVLDGEVTLNSSGEGSVFTIDLPLELKDEASAIRMRTLGRVD
jgi:two-component system phosphate regulon sensor histidine kinase PhoR